jgi:Tfp pilus assembly protein PilF
MPAVRRTAHTDAVMSAFGYRTEKTRDPAAVLRVVAGLVAVGLVTAWLLMPQSGFMTFVRERVAPAPPPMSAIPKPPPAPPSRLQNNPVPKARTHVPAPPTLPAIDARDPSIARPQNRPRSPILELRTLESTPDSVRAAPAAPKAVTAAPDEFQLALYYQRSGDFEQALMHYRAALQRDEMNVEAHNNLGNLYLGKGLFEEAAREFQRVIAIDPKYLNAHVNLSAAYTRLGRPDAAAAEARAALQIDGRNPDALVNLALAQHDAGLTGDAQRSLRLALEIEPRNAAAHYNLARQFEAAGELSSAIAHYNQFIQYASPEQTAFVADVRVRVTALTARLK